MLYPPNSVNPGTMDTMTRLQYYSFKGMSSSGRIEFENQRIHAAQTTSSCELKSTTVACGLILQDELAYQTLIGSLLLSAKNDASQHNLQGYNPQFAEYFERIDKNILDVKNRIILAANPQNQD